MNIWLEKLAKIVYPYFSQPYTDKKRYTRRKIDDQLLIVNRPNHGFVFAMRQAILTAHICQYLSIDNFDQVKKLMFVSAFQRSGRQSEISSEENSDLYYSYELSDVENFKKEAFRNAYLFSGSDEINEYANALHWQTNSQIGKIIHTAHILDLRRIPHFNMNKVKKDACICLFGKLSEINNVIIDLLFDKSGVYLKFSGDRDAIRKKIYYSNNFYRLSVNTSVCADLFYDIWVAMNQPYHQRFIENLAEKLTCND
jgi:hypothetical protein